MGIRFLRRFHGVRYENGKGFLAWGMEHGAWSIEGCRQSANPLIFQSATDRREPPRGGQAPQRRVGPPDAGRPTRGGQAQ